MDKVIKNFCIATGAFLLGRVTFFGTDFILPLALMMVILCVDSIYIYLAPLFWIGMASTGGIAMFWGDLSAMMIASLILIFVGRKKLRLPHRILIAVGSYTLCNMVYLIISEKTYMMTVSAFMKENLLLIFLILIFEKGLKGNFSKRYESRFFAITPLVVLAASSILSPKLGVAFGVLALLFIGIFEKLEELCLACITTGLCLYLTYNGAVEQRDILALMGLCVLWGEVFNVIKKYFWKSPARRDSKLIKACIRLKDLAMGFKELVGIRCQSHDQCQERLEKVLAENINRYNLLSKYYRDIGDQRQIFSFQLQAMEKTLTKALEDIGSLGERAKELFTMKFGHENYGSLGKCGDSLLCKNLADGRSLMVISDGMGKGEEAFRESQLVIQTLEKMIECGMEPQLALKSINTVMMNNQGETFATVDLALIDKAKGYLDIYKMGAATTYIKRRDKIHAINCCSLPAGITSSQEIKGARIKIKNGDIIVMVSDGIIDCDRKDEGGNWIKEKLITTRTKDPDTIAQLIISKSIEKYGIKERDDLTVLVGCVV